MPMNKQTLTLGAILLVILLGASFFLANNQVAGSTGTRFPNGLSTDTTSPVAGQVRGTTLTFTSTGLFGGLLTLDAGLLKSYTNATTTSKATQTLLVSDIAGYDSISMQPLVAALTLTLPASSTATTWLPTAGDVQTTCFLNSTSTAAATITFVAGTGIDWENVSTTTPIGGASPPAPIPAIGAGCFTFIRQVNTDISALYVPYVNAD